MNEAIGPFTQALQELFAYATQISGLSVRYKDVDPRLRLNMPRQLVEHRDSYCMKTKSADSIKQQRCQAHCSFEGIHQSYSKQPKSVSTCHAACTALRRPVFAKDELIGYLIIGPYQRGHAIADLAHEYAHIEAVCSLLHFSIVRLATERSIERNDFMRNDLHPSLKLLANQVQRWQHNYSLAALAQECNVSLSRLQHLCKEELGETLGSICDRALMHQAQDLLRLEHNAIGTVAWELGFEDQRYFATWFKRVAGQTPSAWRKQQAHVDI